MGYSPTVDCDCLTRGLITPPMPVCRDDDGHWRAARSEDSSAFWHWRRDACKHRGWLAELDLNSAAMAAVREAAAELSLSRLVAELPEWNGCTTSAADAALLLPEIEILAAAETQVQRLRDDGGRIAYSLNGSEGWLWVDRGRTGWLTHGRLEIRDGIDTVAMSCTRFGYLETPEPKAANGQGRYAAYTPLTPPGPALEAPSIHGIDLPHPERPALLSVTAERDRVHADTAAGLRRLCEAAVATGNPIAWG